MGAVTTAATGESLAKDEVMPVHAREGDEPMRRPTGDATGRRRGVALAGAGAALALLLSGSPTRAQAPAIGEENGTLGSAIAESLGIKAQGPAPTPTTDNRIHYFLLVDQLESQFGTNGTDALFFNVLGWAGGDYNRVWLNAQGTQVYGGPLEDTDVQLLYGRLIAPFWDLQAGVRYFQSNSSSPPRASAVLGILGLAPYWFETQAALFISNKGEVSARLELEYELLLTQRLILQPRLETNVSAQRVSELEVGQGVNDLEVGLRLRYEIRREFAPYLGVSWKSKFGETADFARAAGEPVQTWSIVLGVRLWF